MEKLTKNKFSLQTTHKYMSQCKHVKETEEDYMQNEHTMDNSLENFIINIGSSDT